MLGKDFENFELRLQKLKEESHDIFRSAEDVFQTRYESVIREVFPRDALGVKSYLRGYFAIEYADKKISGKEIVSASIFKQVLHISLSGLYLSSQQKAELEQNISSLLSTSNEKMLQKTTDISRDPFFALVEDFALDGNISPEEFSLLQQSYSSRGDFIDSLQALPRETKVLFEQHLNLLLSPNSREKKLGFESEYAPELKKLSESGINIESVIVFVSRNFYKSPGKLKKYESPKRRMRRTFKMALLRLLRMKFGNVKAADILEKFESGESFEDYFMLIYKLMEIIDENPASEEVFMLQDIEESTTELVYTAEENKQKILDGESLVMKIAGLFSKADASLEQGILGKLLEDDTHFIGDEVHFAHGAEDAGILADGNEKMKSDDEDEDEDESEPDYDTLSPEVAYEMLQHQFQKIEEDKRQAFLAGEYDCIDSINEKLLAVQSKLEKIIKILGLEI